MRSDCPLCLAPGGREIWRNTWLRVIHAQEPGLEAFYRVVWNAHVAEWTDLDEARQLLCMRAVGAVEQALREVLQPRKVNLATLGNVVPHMHWHVVARFDWDGHFPAPVWAPPHTPAQDLPPERVQWLHARLPEVERQITSRLQGIDWSQPNRL
ncbi:HIT family protein [Corticibacter populi]|uniref:HIT family protein n=1 Tax=Corticibacter populi TaxID=1550736 RepID=UPI001F5EA819|nr:HIT family protein [Corticibacter populi]